MKRLIQYIHRPNRTELGKGNTHETYLLISKQFNLSDFFPTAADVRLQAVDTNIFYTVKSSGGNGKEFRINQFGPLYHDYDVSEGDVIVITISIEGEQKDYFVRVNKYNNVVLYLSNKGCEIGNLERLAEYGNKENGYTLSVDKDGVHGVLRIIFDGAKAKRDDSPDLTDFYKVLFNGVVLENGSYALNLDSLRVEKFDKAEYNEIYLDGEEITNSQNKATIPPQLSTSSISTTYRPYITAIKSKPFLLLAGISGTGKSRIVRELARACYEPGTEEYKAHKPANYEMVQVKPNWHDSSELIGYVSRVSGKPEYIAGTFLKFIVKAWEHTDTPYFLCLDEMNLAPVEQYFAEYLSVIETRKYDEKSGIVITDPILKAEFEPKTDAQTGRKILKPWYDSLLKDLLSDCPDEKSFGLLQQFIDNGISLPPNLIVVGTVNMDETTFSFSRKVLDRAMTIEMNEVDLKSGLDKHHEQIGLLSSDHLIGTAVEGVDIYEANTDVCNKVLTYLEKVNQKLEDTPFKIAYRTRNEFLLYAVNNLPYNKDENGNDIPQELVIARALDEITSMKILSRIEGDETKVSENFLNDLKKVIEEQLHDIDGNYNTADSISLKKLEQMKKRLASGYTSFWS